MVLTLTSAEITRCGLAKIKKSGISWKGWRERWIVLKSNYLLVYKNTEEHQFKLRLSLASVKAIHVKDPYPRFMKLTFLDGTQYSIAFQSNTELEGWYKDINQICTLPSPSNYEEGDILEIIDGYFIDHESPSTERAATPDSFASELSGISITLNPTKPQISSSPNLLNFTDTGQHALGNTTSTLAGTYNLTAHERVLVRRAISFLCSCMEPRLLRRSDPGGEKPFDLVEIRLRALLRAREKWTSQHDALNDYETIVALSEALKDGYVLCQALNAIGFTSMVRPSDRDNGNLAKFLSHCRDMGIQRADLFSLADLTAVTAESSVKVARAILNLAKVSTENLAMTAESMTKFSESTAVILQKEKDRLSSIEVSVDEFIATQTRKGSLRFDERGLVLKVFLFLATDISIQFIRLNGTDKNITSYLEKQAVALQHEGMNKALMKLVDFMASLDTISSLVQSRQFRIRLLQFAAEFHVSDYQALREALKKDDTEITEILRIVVYSNEHKQAITGLQGKDAQNCVDLMQEVLDRRSRRVDGEDEFYHHVQRLLVKLSECTDLLPTSLFIKGVTRQDTFACYGGTFGDIFRATYREQDVALKRIRVFQGDVGKHQAQRKLCREALLWQRLHHPFVLDFCGIDSESFPSYLCMVSPWMSGGTILKHLNENGHANVERILFEVAQGLEYLHSQRIIHGDLRGSNILVNDWHACIADFGLAVFGDATMATQSQQAGSVRWMAPELHHPQAFGLEHFQRTTASDVYSFACVCVELFIGKHPFIDIPHDAAVMLHVMSGGRPERSAEPSWPEYLWELVELCWSHNPSERPSMSQVVNMMKAANPNLVEVVTESPTEAFDWDMSLHNPSGTTLVRGSRLGSRSAAVRRPPYVHKTTLSS